MDTKDLDLPRGPLSYDPNAPVALLFRRSQITNEVQEDGRAPVQKYPGKMLLVAEFERVNVRDLPTNAKRAQMAMGFTAIEYYYEPSED